ncbi:NADP-dependent oxidoreductase [Ruicaihuangia caeni]|uniref:NADP-dependent oxidoreductase n=1 Tax=Ruicaihuangia caeni TaxID=3042517 RepID=A0AAW6T345_9MICO|nr:NADP-dependent oxidoreductase [Klugiella sp. YN-L-19]MDI2097531.1 NADP-dependent oxidoreductase [Klugiella sp. YN-L-19]
MSRYVRVTRFGGPEVLEVVDDTEPHAGSGQVRVRVHFAGVNPVDRKIFAGGETAARWNAVPPYINGNDYAGVVDQVGAEVDGVRLGDAVFGGARHLAQADYVVVDADTVLHKPGGLSMQQAGALDIAGRAAIASVRTLRLSTDDTVFVSAAAGGVGVLAVQLARLAGATVIGAAGLHNHDFLRSLGVIPVLYGEGMVERIRDAAPAGVTAALDYHGVESIDAALELGVRPERINTTAAKTYRPELGMHTVGGQVATPAELERLAGWIADGSVVLPIEAVYPLERVREAYQHLAQGHLRGKLVLDLGAESEPTGS